MNTRGLRRALAVVSACGILGVAPSASAGLERPSYITRCGLINVETGARKCTYTFVHTRDVETFIVPPSNGPIEITAVGAPGFGEDAVRSRGARVSGSFTLLSGTPLFITVGGDGYYDGYNGGEDGGGGASDVRVGFPDLEHRIIVAGGGGGAGQQLIFDRDQAIWRFVVVKGGDAGQAGLASGGRAGTDTAGGEGGGNGTEQGQAGALGRGGAGADRGGGGGGGGLYGGGGGGGCLGGDDKDHLCLESQPGSGGGGSSLVPPGGSFALSDNVEPSVTITVTQYG
jgi:glycine rich protein